MKIILQLDGGGAKGLAQATVLSNIEKITGKKIYDIVDLIIGTSVGTIIGGIISRNVRASTLFDMMYKAVDDVFDPSFWRSINFIGNGKYSKKPLVNLLENFIDKNDTMSNVKVNLMITSFCINDNRNHYFKSWEDKDGKLNLIDAINRSYAAPYYFEPVNDDKEKMTWLDGGIGDSNCSIDQAWIEAERLGWLEKEEVVIISIGTGYSKKHIPYKKSKRYRNMRSLGVFMNPSEGGAARAQSVRTKMTAARTVESMCSNLTIIRLDAPIPSKIDKLDKPKYKDKYVKLGDKLTKMIDFKKLGY